MSKVQLQGDKAIAQRYVSWAQKKLDWMRKMLKLGSRTVGGRVYKLKNARISISIVPGVESINIYGFGGMDAILICHVGDSTSGAHYVKKYYAFDGPELREITETELKGRGWSLIDDGKYGVNMDISGPFFVEDPDDYSYYIPKYGDGIGMAEGPMSIDAKNASSGYQRRFMMNQAAEVEAWRDYAAGDGFSALSPQFRLSSRHYALSAFTPMVCRYAGDGILAINSTVDDAAGSVLLVNTIEYFNYLESLQFASKAFWKPLDTTKTKKSITLPGATFEDNSLVVHDGASLVASVQYYPDGRMSQDILRATQFDFVPDNEIWFDEPIAKSRVNISDGSTVSIDNYHRGDGLDPNKYFQDTFWNSDRTVDGPTKLVTNAGFSSVANDIILYTGVKHTGAVTGVRMEKTTDGASMRVSVVVADNEVASSEFQDTIWKYADDYYAAPQVVGDLGRTPIVIIPINYTIIHTHHGAAFDVVVFVKTEYVSYNESWTGYKTAWTGSSLFAGPQARIRENFITSTNTYYICVNGVVEPLGYSHTQVERQLTIAPVAIGGGETAIIGRILNDSVGDAGYDWQGNALSNQYQVARIFTSENDRLTVAFDVYPISYKHQVDKVTNDLGYNVDVGSTPAVPPTLDSAYVTPTSRKLMIFGSSGTVEKTIDFPEKSPGVKWNRLNGMCFMETTT